MRKKKHGIRAGFTLIELLAVMAIIALLASVLLTALTAARRAAKKTTVRDEVMQIKTAWTAYLNEYRRFPSVPLTEMDGTAVEILRGDDTALALEHNPKEIIFMDFRHDVVGQPFADPWEGTYRLEFDTDGNNRVSVHGQQLPVSVAVWSHGPDGKNNTKDDIVSWGK